MPKPESNPNSDLCTRHQFEKVNSYGIGPRLGQRISDFGLLAALFIGLLACGSGFSQETPTPLTRVHAHNDYEHNRPLLDALDHGFCSVEADIFLVDDRLLVAHTRSQVKPNRTLESLYLEPLRQRIEKNGGRVYPGGPEIVLLIDIKTDWKSTYPALRERLRKYANILTIFRGETAETNAVRAIITGNRSLDMFAGETIRYAAYDGDLKDLSSGASPLLVPWISASWYDSFRWKGTGPMPAQEKQKLKGIVETAHAQGRRLRFWGAPDFPAFWRMLFESGVDLINTDDLAGAQKFLLHP